MLQGILIMAWLASASGPGTDTALFWRDVLPASAIGELSQAGVAMLQAHVEGGVDAELRWSDFRELQPELLRISADREWRLAWTSRGRPTDQAWQVATLLLGAER